MDMCKGKTLSAMHALSPPLAGATHSNREWLLFLHADCQLPEGYFASITEALAAGQRKEARASVGDADSAGPVWGCFSTIETGHPQQRIITELVRLRTRWQSKPYGDQGLFVKASVFSQVLAFHPVISSQLHVSCSRCIVQISLFIQQI
jgi:hypothetical protein